MAWYLPKLRHLLIYYINLHRDFFGKIRSNHINFDHKRPRHQLNIIEIIINHKIIKKRFCSKDEAYNNKMRTM